MVAADTIAVFVPILFLLVVELANLTRDTIPLSKAAEKEVPPISVFGRKEAFGHDILPNLGRFLLIHWAAMMLLSLTVFVSLSFTDDILQAGLVFATSVLLYFYPALEVSEYDSLLSSGHFPTSYKNHLVYVSVLIGLTLPAPFILAATKIFTGPIGGFLFLSFLFAILPFLAARSFTIRLKEELKGE